MPPLHGQAAHGQKRKRAPEDTIPPPVPQWKRAGFRSAEEAKIAFWDNLPGVPLCPSALKEFDRRYCLSVGPGCNRVARSTGRIAGRITRSTARRAAEVNPLVRQNIILEERTAQLKHFARRGGPDLHDLRGYPEPAEASPTMPRRKTPSRTPSGSNQSTSRGRASTSAYQPGFEKHLILHGIYPCGFRGLDGSRAPRPDNWGGIQQVMRQPRPSLSPSRFSDGAFEAYVQQNNEAIDEAGVMAKVFPILEGNSGMLSGIKRTFSSLAPLTDGTIVAAQPDVYDGARSDQLNQRVQDDLKPYIVPSSNDHAPILPNNFTELKGPTGTMAVVKRQACHNGAIGARAMQHLQSYGLPEPVYDNNTYTITSAFDGEHLHIYTTHHTAPASPGARPEYHMNQLGAFALTGDAEFCRRGMTAYRNLKVWTKERRDEFIEAANERSANLPQATSVETSGYSDPSTSTHLAAAIESETSTDELALDDVPVPNPAKRSRRGGPGTDSEARCDE
ncbi:hypothetical protein LTR41_007096 [Exophiala xenobiotica]|nr:hypothetical protein LTR41_007096 [Exophiala xenobiotica]